MKQANTRRIGGRVHRSGASMIELLIVVGILIALAAIIGSAITGTEGQEGAKDRVERQIQQLNLHYVYQGFRTYSSSNDGNYPSTKTHSRMDSDTTHEVFRVLIEEGVLDGRQLVSDNEMEDITPGDASNFGPMNTSFALNDYDADDWLRYRKWNDMSGAAFALMSDRDWVDPVGSGAVSINFDWWHVLMNDGSTQIARGEALKPGTTGDHLFRRDSGFGALDALMVHD